MVVLAPIDRRPRRSPFNSAIAAVGSVIGVGEGEISVAMGTVFILNAAALYVFPVVEKCAG